MWMALTIYQIGGVLHDLVTKRPLFDDLVKTENKFALAMAVLSNVPNLADVHGSMLQWAAVASNCLVKDPDLRVALVDLRRIKPGGKTGRQRLQEMTERQKVLREAKDAKEQQENELLQLRTSALDALQGIVKQRLIELIDKTYGVVAYVNQDASVVFEVAIDSRIKLHMHFSFGWLGAFTPLVAKAELVAWLGSAPDVGSLKRRAVGQFAAESKIDEVFATAMLEAISEVVVVASEHVDLSTSFDATSSIVDAIFLLLNEQPLR